MVDSHAAVSEDVLKNQRLRRADLRTVYIPSLLCLTLVYDCRQLYFLAILCLCNHGERVVDIALYCVNETWILPELGTPFVDVLLRFRREFRLKTEFLHLDAGGQLVDKTLTQLRLL